jgi:hypothetical protein
MSHGKLSYNRNDANLTFEAELGVDEQVALAMGIVMGLDDVGRARFVKDLHAVMNRRASMSPLAQVVSNLLHKHRREVSDIVIPRLDRGLLN